MKPNVSTFEEIHHPTYILEEKRLRNNLERIKNVACQADVEIILAFKAYALWKTFPIFKEYIHSTTASSLYEAKLGYEEFGAKTHTYSPAYTDDEIEEIACCSSHLTFNSINQMNRFSYRAKQTNPSLSMGLRVNPEYSEVATALYNPCAPGTRFGVIDEQLPQDLPSAVEGFHCHTLCESGADVFKRTLAHIETHFSKWLPQLKWINFGGGHLMTREDYDVNALIRTLQEFHLRYPNLKIILEPGSAFAWQTGCLVAQVVDIVENRGIKTAILNVSFTCHMPDCLEMPYLPKVRGAETLSEKDDLQVNFQKDQHIYRLGGNSCLSGDFMDAWKFDHKLQIGENIVFEDMLHYTTVKTNMFNGINHPSIAIIHLDGKLEVLRKFEYQDYKYRMD